MVLNEEQWIKELREKRIAYGISQGRLAVASGITREYLNKIESGKMKPSKELLETLHKELARFNPEAPLTMLFDYVKIRFPTLDIQHIIKDILKLNINYMLHEDYGHYTKKKNDGTVSCRNSYSICGCYRMRKEKCRLQCR